MLNPIWDSLGNTELDLTLLSVWTFPLSEAFLLPTGEILIMLIMLNPTGLRGDASLMLQNKICAIFAENFSKMVFFWCPWFRTIFLHRKAFLRKCSGPPVWGGARNVTNWFFLGGAFLLFWFDLARCLSSWWMVERLYQNDKKKEKTNSYQWQQLLV